MENKIICWAESEKRGKYYVSRGKKTIIMKKIMNKTLLKRIKKEKLLLKFEQQIRVWKTGLYHSLC